MDTMHAFIPSIHDQVLNNILFFYICDLILNTILGIGSGGARN